MILKSRAAAPKVKNLVITLPLLGIMLIALAASSVRAQAPTDNGTPLGLAPGSPEGSYALSGFENVNLYNGGLSFSLPVMQIGGRGKAGYTVQVPIDSKWMVTKNEWYDQNNMVYYSFAPSSSAGTYLSNYGPGSVSIRYSQWKPETCNIGSQYFTTYRWATTSVVFTAPDGTEHELVDQATLGRPTNYPSCSLNGSFRGPVFVSRNEPGMTFISDVQIRDAPYYAPERITGFLKMPDGTVYRFDAIDHNFPWGSYSTNIVSWIRDPNGNKTIFTHTTGDWGDRLTSIKDSLNRQITIEYNVTEAPYGTCDRLTYKGFGGANRVVRVCRGSLSTALRAGSTNQT
jgi:hypothetical protein